jgi:hypothetical protein
MERRWFGIGLLCLGAMNALMGILLAFQGKVSNIVLPYAIVFVSIGMMICGYFVGKGESRK